MRRLALTLMCAGLTLGTACSGAPDAEGRSSAGTTAERVEAPAGNLRTVSLRVPDMSCALCARPIEKNLQAMGVHDVKADLETKWVTGRFDPDRLTPEAIRQKVEELKFRVMEVRVS